MSFCNDKHPLNNCAIKVQSKEHGKKVIEFWNSQGVNTCHLLGNALGVYYGLFDGKFDWKYTLCGEKEIFLPEEKLSIDLTKGWVVECKDEEETSKVANFIKGSDRKWSFFPCVINHLGILNYNFKDFNFWRHIPPEVKHLPVLTFKQFEQLILNNKNKNMKEKEVIGYKLVKPEYTDAAKKICSHVVNWRENDKFHLSIIETVSIPKLKEAGVLDLWFEPVFRQEETIFEFSPTFKVKVSGKQVFYENEEITLYVKELINKFQSSYIVSNKGLRAFAIEEVIFKVTGCVTEPTKLSQWKELYDLIKD